MSTESELEGWLDRSSVALLEQARGHALGFGQRYARAPHVLLAALEGGLLDHALAVFAATRDDVLPWLTDSVRAASPRHVNLSEEPRLHTLTSGALAEVARRRGLPLTVNGILEAILRDGVGLDARDLEAAPDAFVRVAQAIRSGRFRFDDGAAQSLRSNGSEIFDTVPIAAGGVLVRFGEDLADSARQHADSASIVPDPTIDRIAGILGRLSRPNVLLIGEPGVGKTTLVRGLARRLGEGRGPAWLASERIVGIPCATLLGGAGYRGQLEERLQQVLDNALLARDTILFMDDLHVLGDSTVGTGGGIYSVFNSYLTRGGFRMIAAADSDEFMKTVQSNRGFLERFEVVEVSEPPREQVLRILEAHLPSLRRHYGLDTSAEVLPVVWNTAERFMPSLRFPAKAIHVLDSAFQAARAQGRAGESSVTADNVFAVVAEETRIPVDRLSSAEQLRLESLLPYLRDRVFDQAQATDTMAKAVQSARLGLTDPKRTKLSFMFVGPPGTGKTEIAKALAEYLMGSERALVRFNMSEFQTPESYQRLVGPPPGYVGFDQGGELTNALLKNPYSVVLFDEIEKGSNRVFDVLLQVLSDGHLSDNHGRVVDCKNSIFVMTSNAIPSVEDLNETEIRDKLLAYSDAQARSMAPTFRREFLDRLEIVPFMALRAPTLRRIAEREITRVLQQAHSSGVMEATIRVSDECVDWLVGKIDAAVAGARPVQRLVERHVAQLIAKAFIERQLEPGRDYRLQVRDGKSMELRPQKEG